MILQALCDYYQRKTLGSDAELAPPGFEEKAIPFIIVLNHSGEFVALEDTRVMQGKKVEARIFRVPKSTSRSSGKAYEIANPLWDHYGYIVAQAKIDKPGVKPSDKDIEMAKNQHKSFIRLVNDYAEKLPNDSGLMAMKRFLASEEQKQKIKNHDLWQECLKIKGCNLSFRLANNDYLVCQSPNVIDLITKQTNAVSQDSQQGICLVTGQKATIARLHGPISGVNSKPSPFAAVNSEKLKSCDSYGKTQGFNFPVGENSVFQYTTALNYLLRKESPNKFKIHETVIICWSEKSSDLETTLPLLFSGATHVSPDAHINAVKSLFSSIHNGAYTSQNSEERFYILGLTPNSARIVVKLWQVRTISQIALRIADYFENLDIVGRDHYGIPSLYRLLCNIVLENKVDNIPSNLIIDATRSILAGLPFPTTLLQLAIRRIKAEQEVTYWRAALIKAYLNRSFRQFKPNEKELTVSLNITESRVGYRLGRLFAVLEKIQQDVSNPGSTIRDRYYGAASSNPGAVFATVIKLSKHHLAKLEGGLKVNRERLIAEIMDGIQNFPMNLSLEDQGLFAIGYYHQRQDLFTKKLIEQGE